jgi:hypothetical protein
MTKDEVIELSKAHDAFCISIFIPTHHLGEEMLKKQDALVLKNQLKGIKLKLEQKGMNLDEIEQFVMPINELIKDDEFWKQQSNGLAIFRSDSLFKKYIMPLNFKEFSYLSNEFYLKPLMPFFNDDERFYILSLKLDDVKFYVSTRDNIKKVHISNLIPSRLEDSVGYEYEQKSLQFRTQQANKGLFHGHGENKDEEKNEILRYFREINNGLMILLHKDQKPPLVVCCLDYHFSIYQEVNTYQHLFSQHVSGNPADKDLRLLHKETWEIVHPYFSRNLQEKIDQFLQFLGTEKASSNIKEILPAAIQGKVDTLFLEENVEIFGIYNALTQETQIQEEFKEPNISLVNLVAMKVFEQGGVVYLMKKEDMPDGLSKINALYSY